MKKIFPFVMIMISECLNAQTGMTNFPSLDSLPVFCDLYFPVKDTNASVILLCHQAGFSRGEYRFIAKRLNALGFNCMAIDQRKGGEVNGVSNVTADSAKQRGMTPSYLDAEQDIVAAVDMLDQKFHKKTILWGSSYSASLAMKIGNENENVSAVFAFSPGEYFPEKHFLLKHIQNLRKPCYIFSSQEESATIKKELMPVLGNAHQFIPKQKGEHGSKALWKETSGNEEYWTAVNFYLNDLKKKAEPDKKK